MNVDTDPNAFSVLVLSSDDYCDLWPGFFDCFFTHFSGSKWPVFLGSNTIAYSDSRVTTIFSGEDKDWSTSMVAILKQVPTKKVFVILEDLYLYKSISMTQFTSVVRQTFSNDFLHVQLWPNRCGEISEKHEDFLIIPQFSPYRTLVCGIWDTRALIDLLIPGENPWKFELFGSYRSSYSVGVVCTKVDILPHLNMVEKGSYFRRHFDWAVKTNIPVSLDRQVLNGSSRLKSLLQSIVFNTMTTIPWRYRVSLLNFFRKILVSY